MTDETPVPLALVIAARSPDVRGRDLAVLIELHGHLSADEWRRIPAWRVADDLGQRWRRNAERSIARLVAVRLVLRMETPEGPRYRLPAPQELSASA